MLALVFPEVYFSLDDIHSTRQGRLGEERITTIPKVRSTWFTLCIFTYIKNHLDLFNAVIFSPYIWKSSCHGKLISHMTRLFV